MKKLMIFAGAFALPAAGSAVFVTAQNEKQQEPSLSPVNTNLFI